MKYKVLFSFFFLLTIASAALIQTGCGKEVQGMSKEEMVERGKYLVTLGGCNHCHSPKVFTPEGPVANKDRLMAGFPENSPVTGLDSLMRTGSQMITTNMELTAWVGPWGVSFAANLTPDNPTGIGTWTEDVFIKALRSGKHMGAGRQILPPMPWEDIGKSTDEDLKSIFAYLKSLPPVRNAVPDPIPPTQELTSK